MKIAILGTRGLPPQYGGFETFVAELGTRLVKRGHEVIVYCRIPLPSGEGGAKRRVRGEQDAHHWNGIRCATVPFIKGKYFETVTHTFASALHVSGADVVLLCNAANAFTIPLLQLKRIPVAINVDGIERRRRKWNALGRAFYAAGEAFAATFADRVIADADVIARYYFESFGIEADTIPYGAEFPEEPDTDVLGRLGVEPRSYLLYVSRFEPENNPLEVVRAYETVDSAPPLVMVGDAVYAKGLLAQLRRHESDRIFFPGAIYGADYRTLQRNALVYIQATEVGGTHPALIEAMGSGGCVLANDTPENREVGGDAVRYFRLDPVSTLADEVRVLLAQPGLREILRDRARRRAAEQYAWEAVTDRYELLFQELAGIH